MTAGNALATREHRREWIARARLLQGEATTGGMLDGRPGSERKLIQSEADPTPPERFYGLTRNGRAFGVGFLSLQKGECASNLQTHEVVRDVGRRVHPVQHDLRDTRSVARQSFFP